MKCHVRVFAVKVAAANYSSAMEADTILKKRAEFEKPDE